VRQPHSAKQEGEEAPSADGPAFKDEASFTISNAGVFSETLPSRRGASGRKIAAEP